MQAERRHYRRYGLHHRKGLPGRTQGDGRREYQGREPCHRRRLERLQDRAALITAHVTIPTKEPRSGKRLYAPERGSSFFTE